MLMSRAVLRLRRCGLKRAKLWSRVVVMVSHCTLTQVNIYPNYKAAFKHIGGNIVIWSRGFCTSILFSMLNWNISDILVCVGDEILFGSVDYVKNEFWL